MKDKRFTALLETKYIPDKEDEQYEVIYVKQCSLTDDQYSIIEFIVHPSMSYDLAPECIMYDIKALILHEDNSNYFLIDEDNLEELDDLFEWSGAGELLMAEMLSLEDKSKLLISYMADNKLSGDIEFQDDDKNWKQAKDYFEGLFNDSFCVIRFKNKEEKICLDFTQLIDDYRIFKYAVKKSYPYPTNHYTGGYETIF